MIEQRRHPRVKVLLPIEITTESPRAETFSATCLDLSGGGVLCQMERKLAKGSDVSLKVAFAENDVFDTSAKVVRVKRTWTSGGGYSIAMEFSAPSAKLVERLTYFLLYPPAPIKDLPVPGVSEVPVEA